jgi:hypothetical protein
MPVFDPFGFREAENIYHWRREAYVAEREAGEDIDLGGEVEFADPAKVVDYIRESGKLRLKTSGVPAAIASIGDARLRDGIRKRPSHVPGFASDPAAGNVERVPADPR